MRIKRIAWIALAACLPLASFGAPADGPGGRRGGPGGARGGGGGLLGGAGAGPAGRGAQEYVPVAFSGWDYETLGYTLNPGENLELLLKNNQEQDAEIPVQWSVTTYDNSQVLSEGGSTASVPAGESAGVPVSLPDDLPDGHYWIKFSAEAEGLDRDQKLYFDFRRPVQDADLNLNIVVYAENMDQEGWMRTMLGPLAKYANVWASFPEGQGDIDALVAVGELLEEDDAWAGKITDYVNGGGTLITFGKVAPAMESIVPVEVGESWAIEEPMRLEPADQGPWADYDAEEGPLHYGMNVEARDNAQVLARWSDGTPAVVSAQMGQGKVIYAGVGTGQVWQDRPSLETADELMLRLLYGETGKVQEMLAGAERLYQQEEEARQAIRDHVADGIGQAVPDEFAVVNMGNIGRYGWAIQEGGLVEEYNERGEVAGPRTIGGGRGGGAAGAGTGVVRNPSFYFTVDGQRPEKSTGVEMNWLLKTIEWRYPDGAMVRSNMSMASPAMLWQGDAANVGITGGSLTHLAYPTADGVKVAASGENIDPAALSENWLVGFIAEDNLRDLPQLIVLTSRPESITFDGDVEMEFGSEGFGAILTSRLWGIRRLAPGESAGWTDGLPENAVEDARRWSRANLAYPVDCNEIGWVEDDMVVCASRFKYQRLASAWGTEPLTLAAIPPAYYLAERIGSPVHLPDDAIDLNCGTKYGPLKAVEGDSVITRITMPHTDHRAIVPAEGRMVLQDVIDQRVQGLSLNELYPPDRAVRNQGGGGALWADLAPYDYACTVPVPEAPVIDVYKWWISFNALLARPVYSEEIREAYDRNNKMRYWETLNWWNHKNMVVQKREPFSGIQYLVVFVWPTQTDMGFRNYNDINEASGVDSYCVASYARYYGDWTTIKANFNYIRRLHEYYTQTNDWALMVTGAREYWIANGIDMLNTEPYGNLAFAYLAENAGYPRETVLAKVLGARALVPAVGRMGMADYVETITTEGDPWRDFVAYYYFDEGGLRGSNTMSGGGINMQDTSKGTMHELCLAYKMWAPEAIIEEMGEGGRALMQSLILGYDRESRVQSQLGGGGRGRGGWNAATSLYELALACVSDIPVFPSDWAPAEYIDGHYDMDAKVMNLQYQSHLGEPFTVRIYSQYEPVSVEVNGQALGAADWRYEESTGWLSIPLEGEDQKNLEITLGEAVAPLHPYFTDLVED